MLQVTAGGAEIPALGFGTFQLSGEECRTSVETALEAGYRHIDTAEYYDNERDVGEALERADVDRESVFLTTKVWRSNLEYDDAIAAAGGSLERLGVEYVDLLLVHWPHPRISTAETLAAMDDLRERGLTRHVGVSNFTRPQLSEAESLADSPIVTDQVLYHPYKDQTALHDYCVESDIALTAYSPLARGAVLDDPVLAEIGGKYDKSPAQVNLRWLVQQESVVAIPRSSSPAHIEANADIFDFELTASEIDRIDGLSGSLSIRLRNKLPALMRSFPV